MIILTLPYTTNVTHIGNSMYDTTIL
jgi:hypothetical protein